ncbi:TetR/AcrR family transcriptional regulator [Nocardioidaceae bacterium]|nr:TetR/AcrR family transcriptional regulator [Nocardioidaceae bacterium]
MPPPTTRSPRTPVRTRLLEAADELFYAEGIAGTGVDAVLSRSGAAIGSLYSHFGGKDGLVLAYLQAREDRWREVWDAEVARHDRSREQVLAIFDAQERWSAATPSHHGCAHAAAVAQLPAGHPARTAALGYKQGVRARLADLVAGLDVTEPGDLADELTLLYEGVLVAASLGLPDPARRARNAASRLLEAAAPRS